MHVKGVMSYDDLCVCVGPLVFISTPTGNILLYLYAVIG